MSLKNKLTQLAKSPKGKELIGKAQTMANDPKNREKIEGARQKIEGQIDAAKHKLAERRGEKEGGTPSSSTTDTPAASTTDTPAASTTDAPAASEPATPPPAYGGDDGPKAA